MLKILTLIVLYFVSSCCYAGQVSVYQGLNHSEKQRKNNWNINSNWSTKTFPNAPKQKICSDGEVKGDVDLLLNQNITIGSLNWYGNLFFIYPGEPTGKLTVNNGKSAALWQLKCHYGFRTYADLDLVSPLIISNSTGHDLQLRGAIAGPGSLTINWNLVKPSGIRECIFGNSINDPKNTYRGGTTLNATKASKFGLFRASKNQAFGSGDVKLNHNATLIVSKNTSDCISDSATLYLSQIDEQTTGLNLEKGVQEVVKSLFINNEKMPAGSYGSDESAAEYGLSSFAGPGLLKVLEGPTPLAKSSTIAITKIEPKSIALSGQISNLIKANLELKVFWGLKSGGRKVKAWAHSKSLGKATEGNFSTLITGLKSASDYCLKVAICNDKNVFWLGRTLSFRTYGKPNIINRKPIFTKAGAYFCGQLVEANAAKVSTTIYYGKTDGKKSPSKWQFSKQIDSPAKDQLKFLSTNLKDKTKYYYSYFCSNQYGLCWPKGSQVVSTPSADSDNDITFITISDVHFGYSDAVNEFNTQTIDDMNHIAGTLWPKKLGGDPIGVPEAVVIAGDMTVRAIPSEWAMFTNCYGLNGERLLAYPVREGWGNHDGSQFIITNIFARNLQRQGQINLSDNGLHYSWDWGNTHFVQLNISVGEKWHPYDPHYSLTFLTNDLANTVAKTGRPVIIFQHISMKRHGAIDTTPESKEAFYQAIKNYNIALIIHGHMHNSELHKWKGIDILNLPHMHKELDGKPPFHGFVLFNIKNNKLRLAEYLSDDTPFITYTKDLSATTK